MRMIKKIFKFLAYFIGCLVLLGIASELWFRRGVLVDPSGVYVNEQNNKDTIVLYPDHTFEQTVYNQNGELVYKVKAEWRRYFEFIQTDSIFACDDEDICYYSGQDSTHIKESIFPSYDLFPIYRSGNFSLAYLYGTLATPEWGVFYNRIELK